MRREPPPARGRGVDAATTSATIAGNGYDLDHDATAPDRDPRINIGCGLRAWPDRERDTVWTELCRHDLEHAATSRPDLHDHLPRSQQLLKPPRNVLLHRSADPRPRLVGPVRGGQPLPLQFPWYPYCSALVSNDVMLWMPFTSIPPSRFVDTYSANVPATTVLLGWSFFAQWLTRHVAPFFPTTWGTTNAARLTIGY